MSKIFTFKDVNNTSVNLDTICHLWKVSDLDWYCIKFQFKSRSDTCKCSYKNEDNRNLDFERMTKLLKERKITMSETSMTSHFKDYIEKHRDTFFTLLIIILIDHIFLSGALRDKVKLTTEGLLNRMLPQTLPEVKNEQGQTE